MAKSVQGVLIVIFLFSCSKIYSQGNAIEIESKTKSIHASHYIVPSVLISYGVVTRFSGDLQTLDHKIDKQIQQNIHRKYTFDDHIQYVPYIGIYGLDLCGVRAKHNFLDRTLVLGTSMIFTATMVQGTKHLSRIERPDESNYHSFPSGHTATAFLGAHMLFREYKDESAWIGIAGYGVAITTASMRVVNRKHWLSDVVTGAGVGILCVELSYLMLPVWHKLLNVKDKRKGFVICPVVNQNYLGMNFLSVF